MTWVDDWQRELRSKQERHRRFWSLEDVDRPMIGFRPQGNAASPGYELLGDSWLTPEMLTEDLYNAYRWDLTSTSVRLDCPGDFFHTAFPDCGIPWMEALVGCTVRFSPGSKMAWAKPFARTLEELKERWRLPIERDDPWLDKLRSVHRLGKRDSPWCPVPPVLGRGPLDVLAAAMPTEEMITGLVAQPEEYSQVLARIAEMYVAATAEQLELMTPFLDGFANRRGIWAPGRICMSQEDAAHLLSPTLYRELVNPIDRSIWKHFEYTMMHTHSAALDKMLESLLNSPELRCIEVVIDPNGPSVDQQMPMWKRIQEAGKSLLIVSGFVPGQIRRIGNELSPIGLAFAVSAPNPLAYRDCFD